MRPFFAIIVIIVSFQTALAQDLIVTDTGDSLNCKITKISNDYIHFTFRYENEIRNTLLSCEQIKFYKKEFFSVPEVPIGMIKNIYGDYQKIRLGVNGGWSYMTAKVSDAVPADFHQYIKDLKSGYHLGADFSYFSSEYIGFGLKYSLFRTKNEVDNVSATDPVTGQVRTGTLKDDITLHYVGPTLCTRLSSANKKTHFVADYSLGYLSYKNNATVIDDFTLTSETLGIMLGLGVDFTIDKNMTLGFLFTYTGGALNHFNYNDGQQTKTIQLDKENLESVSRIDLSVALRWYK
jgi:opacity protein-like surface antigen